MIAVISNKNHSGDCDNLFCDISCKRCLFRSLVHHLADITQTSALFRIFGGAIASACVLCRYNFFQDDGSAVSHIIVYNPAFRIVKTIADQLIVLEFMIIKPGNMHSGIFP